MQLKVEYKGERAAARHFQRRDRRRWPKVHNGPRWHLPCQRASGKMRLEVCPCRRPAKHRNQHQDPEHTPNFQQRRQTRRELMQARPGTGQSYSQLKVSLNRVSKVFGTFVALKNLTATFEARNIYAVLGENGAGKSTLLRLLAGLNSKTSGTISWTANPSGTTDSPRQPEPGFLRAHTGYMAHSSMLYDELSAIENLRYFASLYEAGAGKSPPQRIIWCGPDRALQAVGLDPGLKRPVAQYSQGMRQRVSLARAVQHDPPIVLLDEPFSNVDAQSAQKMAALIAAMRDARRAKKW